MSVYCVYAFVNVRLCIGFSRLDSMLIHSCGLFHTSRVLRVT